MTWTYTSAPPQTSYLVDAGDSPTLMDKSNPQEEVTEETRLLQASCSNEGVYKCLRWGIINVVQIGGWGIENGLKLVRIWLETFY